MTTTSDTTSKRVRRNHTVALKEQILAECAAPGASVAQVALAHGINANIVHTWRKQARQPQPHKASATPAFVPLAIEPARSAPVLCDTPGVRIELRRGPVSLSVRWPPSEWQTLSAWTREVLR